MNNILIEPDGTLRFIYTDELAEAFDGAGDATTRRASFVEPDPNGGGWLADMTPVADGVVLGPYFFRKDALNAETDWLREHLGL